MVSVTLPAIKRIQIPKSGIKSEIEFPSPPNHAIIGRESLRHGDVSSGRRPVEGGSPASLRGPVIAAPTPTDGVTDTETATDGGGCLWCVGAAFNDSVEPPEQLVSVRLRPGREVRVSIGPSDPSPSPAGAAADAGPRQRVSWSGLPLVSAILGASLLTGVI
ncbi:hypothetical protein GCM10008994_32190 [Halorubrum ejinorense]|uniref:Uncharacterized protein n=1 Tax=Halorubrum ejinorense TaxID=425309 RepID=A0AAV3SWQ1_9EURY